MGRRCHQSNWSVRNLCHVFYNNTLLLLYFFSLSHLSGGKTLTRIVHTKYGRLQGFLRPLPPPLKPLEVFLGVPYATPPVGVNRFSPTRTPSPWAGVRLADNFSPVCPQHLPRLDNETLENMPRQRLEMIRRLFPLLKNYSEDCLYLNIYSPLQDEMNMSTYTPVGCRYRSAGRARGIQFWFQWFHWADSPHQSR
ncbi:hypothetical protein J6590_066224 [Homalodisca vitripennis]|nr:hypothetical protein J6590_066224 [Homalodisca vitripennis]